MKKPGICWITEAGLHLMSENRWTKEQLEAITESGCNLLVAAAAGAGKTAVLVERILRKITDENNGIDIDRLLVVTFTNAAATEMRERIGERIAAALDGNPGSKRLQRQLTLLHKANITTIHSFCLEVIKNNFHCIDLDPNFRIADETEALLMKNETLEELFEEMYEHDTLRDEFMRLVECYGGSRDDQSLQNMVMSLFEFVQSHPWPEIWLHNSTEAFNQPEGSDFGCTAWAKILIKSVRIELAGLLNSMQKAMDTIKAANALIPYLAVFQKDISGIDSLISSCAGSWDELCRSFASMEFDRLPACGKDADKNVQEQVKGVRSEVKDRLRKIREDIFLFDSSYINRDLKSLYPLVKCLSALVLLFGEKYSAKKKGKSLLDFNDLEHLCLNILTEQVELQDEQGVDEIFRHIKPSPVAVTFRERFEEILVDEYQDSNLIQEVILQMVSRKDSTIPNVFMVGDVKQSIYRFRQARPELFMEKYNGYSNQSGSRDRKILLFKNFRSRKEVIDGVNFVFKQIMSENIGELDYNEQESLNFGADYQVLEEATSTAGGDLELHIIETGSGSFETEEQGNASEGPEVEGGLDNSEVEEEQLDNIQTEARIVVERIKELINPPEGEKIFKVYDRSQKAYRKVEFKDIVILLRTTVNYADVLMEELGTQGIPAYADTGSGYFKTTEVQTVMSLLQIIDNPFQDIPLLCVLRSPIASFTPDELVDIRLANRNASFYEAMKTLAAEGSGAVAEKTAEFLKNLDKWRVKALHMSTDELIWYLYSDTGYYSYAGAMPGGVQRQANLRILFERARQYEETSYKGLFNFINFINRLKSSKGDMGSAKILGENENVVRLMSIHKSKGLEFPVVILAGCGKQFNLQDMNKSILVHQDLGFGPDYVDYLRRMSYPTIPKQALKYKIKLETLSEETRILYVAFTRAREKLIITGTVKSLDKSLSNWSRCLGSRGIKLPEYEMLKSRSYMDWIGPAVIRHKDGELFKQLSSASSKTFAVECPDGYFLIDDGSCWKIRLWNKKDAVVGRIDEAANGDDIIHKIEALDVNASDSAFEEEIRRRLNWEYRYGMSTRLPTKISVTELKRQFDLTPVDEYSPAAMYVPPVMKRPRFMEEIGGFTSVEKGSILHFVLQHLDLQRISFIISGGGPESKLKTSLIEELSFQIGEMAFKQLLGSQQASAVDIEKIVRFLRSPLGTRMLNSGSVKREIPFNLEYSCHDIYRDLPEDIYREETVLLQGAIDCYFEESDGIVLLDYKTDYVPAGGTDLIKEKYRIQIDYYTKALERLTGRQVKEKYLYLFWNGETVAF